MQKKRTQLILTLLLFVQIIALQVLKNFPEFVEKYYSLGIYPLISKVSRFLFGWVPFSVGDLFYVLISFVALRWLFVNFRRIKREPLSFFLDITAAVSVVYFMFHMLWGFNYYRLPLHKSIGIDAKYTTEELIKTTERFITKSNEMHRKLGYPDSVKIDLPFTQQEVFEISDQGYKNLENKFPKLKYSQRSIKKSGWSLGLTYMGYSGYLNPFSGEAQVNNLIKTYKFPVVSCHEQAHQIGYAAENEANFLATLATLHNEDEFIQYSGYIFALRYCVNEVARRDIDAYHKLLETINPGILASYKEMRDFWSSYENPFEVFSKHFYNYFLKANNQSKGIMSYNYMVALVVNYFEDKPL
ncbi:DUF3810 domain-containing protein [Marixanthomonas sp. SCSIO 43207]|uniref:DUF3810 domain-containing protein n=1 Tax=Marixanthomonas sp. SCSIO 43207 TaxID=2779360 RepID=UPI001CA95FA4|nr:DUF3810 domain-containing protein [Marixanthomonas sp. SCSIO 43207]UAB81129.1 DUF3810 domain-containing protein [Marixanthomonas sp. SCSIO 43207]